MRSRWRFALLLGALAAFGGVAHAQAKRIVLDAVDVKGKVQKPEILILITRQNLNREYNLELKESFIPKIVDSIEKKPF